MEILNRLEEKLGYRFKNSELFVQALTHKSVKKKLNNERLEFLGDAVLDLIIGEYLFSRFPNACEGELSKLRASLVNEKSFAEMAKFLGLGEAIFVSTSEESNKGRTKPSLLSNAYEAVIGAIYLEVGIDDAKRVAIAILEIVYPKIDLDSLSKDYKTALQEITQAKFGVIPEYELVKSFGPDHKKEFEISVSIAGKEYARAHGKSKKEAQQESARLAMAILNKDEK